MNDAGYFEYGKLFTCGALLEPLVVKGKYANYLPAPIASYVRWCNDQFLYRFGYRYGSTNPTEPTRLCQQAMATDLAEFLKLTEDEQIAQLCGYILTEEYRQEVGEVPHDEVPF